jgi:hypothetical protein
MAGGGHFRIAGAWLIMAQVNGRRAACFLQSVLTMFAKTDEKRCNLRKKRESKILVNGSNIARVYQET